MVVVNTSNVNDISGSNKINGSKKGKSTKRKNRKIAKSKNLIKIKNHNFSSKSKNTKNSNRSSFHTSKIRLAFTKLTQAFIEALILCYFNQKCNIWIKIDISSYIIGRVYGELALDDLNQ